MKLGLKLAGYTFLGAVLGVLWAEAGKGATMHLLLEALGAVALAGGVLVIVGCVVVWFMWVRKIGGR